MPRYIDPVPPPAQAGRPSKGDYLRAAEAATEMGADLPREPMKAVDLFWLSIAYGGTIVGLLVGLWLVLRP